MSEPKDAPPSTLPDALPHPGDPYVIPPEGSLSLLALGAEGLKRWRDVRDAHLVAQAGPTDGPPAAPTATTPDD